MQTLRILAATPLLLCAMKVVAAPAAEPLYENTTGGGSTDWSKYLADDAGGSVTAAGLLGISGDVVTNVENLRDVVVSFKGLRTDEGKGTLGISITPGRTSWSPFDLTQYKDSNIVRFLSSATISYAQGEAEIEDVEYERQAYAVEMSYIFSRSEDPVIAFDDAATGAVSISDCKLQQIVRDRAQARAPSAPDPQALVAAIEACDKAVKAKLRWNRSSMSISYGQGWIKGKESGAQQRGIGRTYVASLTYGFEPVKALSNRAALTAIYRRTEGEPVLETLGYSDVERKDRGLIVGRLVFGSEKIRAVIEASDAASTEITGSQRTFKEAAGFDVRVVDGLWLNLRFGRQRNIEGTDTEKASLLNISYSPSALLK
ncbi:hypothetical protein [Hydrocarboniphaga effusa]|jgi:hypothetical protein|uniref:hypothetical protein n=1 Tax=Hydrocarboniphaga effusa TaxID=243629 RepID=UPI00313817B6